MAEVDNCGYWKYLGESEVPSSPRVLTRAEKGQALTHLEMDFNLASLFHKLNTSSEGSEFDPEEFQPGEAYETASVWNFSSTPWVTLLGNTVNQGTKTQWTVELDGLEYSTGTSQSKWDQRDGATYIQTEGSGNEANRRFLFNAPNSGTLTVVAANSSESGAGRAIAVKDVTGHIQFSEEVPQSYNTSSFVFENIPAGPVYVYSAGSLRFYGLTFEYNTEETPVDIYFETHKPTREEEMEGLFATFSYAPIINGTESIVQNPPQVIKIQHTTDEIRYKLANEEIPGSFSIREDFKVSGSSYVENDSIVKGNISCSNDIESKTLYVSDSAEVKKLRVKGTASFDGDVNIEGNLYVNGILFGNLSQPGYNSLTNPNYAQQYQRYGTQGTGSHQSDKALKDNLEPISDSLQKVSAISGYSFDWNSKAEKSGHDVGLIAQEVAEILPEAVDEGLDGYLQVDYYKIIPLLVNAIKELKAEVECLKEKNK